MDEHVSTTSISRKGSCLDIHIKHKQRERPSNIAIWSIRTLKDGHECECMGVNNSVLAKC